MRTWTALDADSKLIVSYLVGGRDAGYAHEFMQEVAGRLTNWVQLTTDGHKAYLKAVEGAFGAGYRLRHADQALRQHTRPSRSLQPGRMHSAIKMRVERRPAAKYISTRYAERQNLTMRMSMRRFTRLTNAFSKKAEDHTPALALYFPYYSLVRMHKTLRCSPAMAAGLTGQLWGMEDMVALIDAQAERRSRVVRISRARQRRFNPYPQSRRLFILALKFH